MATKRYTVKEIAEKEGVSKVTIHKRIRAQKIKPRRIHDGYNAPFALTEKQMEKVTQPPSTHGEGDLSEPTT